MPLEDDDELEAKRKRKVEFRMRAWLLARYEYNLKNRMGTLLREKWDFSRKVEARDAYIKTFGKKFEPDLSGIFQNKQLDRLAALRNAIVHQAGVADAEFVKRVGTHQILGRVDEGKVIPVTGPVVVECLRAATISGLKLLWFVDGWLSESEKKPRKKK